ncbi:MAG: polysaccharide pyruvyl transferase family protein [Candidatus Nanohaloarchaea archaeon]
MVENVILGSYGFGNIGDRAILEKVLESYSGETSVTCYNREWIDFDAVKRYYWDPRIVLDVARSDRTIVGGEPVLDPRIDGSVNLLAYYILFMLLLGRLTGSRVILHSIGFYGSNRLTRRLLNLVHPDEITCRDQLSADNMASAGLEPELGYDPVVERTEVETAGEVEKVLVNARDVGNELDIRSRKALEHLVEELQPDYELEGFSTQPVHENPGLSIESEVETDAHILGDTGLGIERQTSSLDEVRTELEDADFLIAYRLHTIIMGVNAGLPVLAVSYHPKVREYCERVGVEYLEHRELNGKKLVSKFRRMVSS